MNEHEKARFLTWWTFENDKNSVTESLSLRQ